MQRLAIAPRGGTRPTNSPWAGTEAGAGEAGEAPVTQVKTNIVLRRQLFSWREVESADYPTYVANLRQIGCPEQTIRDIIIADVNALYSRRRATELVTRGATMVAQRAGHERRPRRRREGARTGR